MDFYLSEENAYNRLREEYKKHGKLIIAYDNDGTIFDYFNEGKEYNNVIALLQRWRNHAHFILYTASGEDRYPSMLEYTKEKNVPCDTINENIKGLDVPKGSKLYYNVLLDDRAGLREVYNMLLKLIEEIEGGLI